MKIKIDYPDPQEEAGILQAYQEGFDARELQRIDLQQAEAGLLTAVQEEVKRVRVEPAVKRVRVEPALFNYIIEIGRRTRDWPALSLGASPRAGVNLMLVAKALAAIDGRDFLIPDDVKAAAPPVLRHRLILRPEADLEGLSPDSIMADVLAAVEIPK
jgi:MoxR-like ATPase